ncbi:MAG: L,D-transpeptidase [Cyanobium sp.]
MRQFPRALFTSPSRGSLALLGLVASLGWALAAGASLAEAQAPPAGASTAMVAPPPPEPPVVREILLELGKRQISLIEGSQVIGRWPVAIGDPSTPTPVGRFTIENMVVNPVYQSTSSGKINATKGPQAPLGDRWIGFKQSGVNQYGIHGTPDAWAWTVTSRAAVSNGCVRMLTPHVRELFSKVQLGTPVIVKP